MSTFSSSADRDANRVVLQQPLPFLVKKTMTFAGATPNDPGDFDGTGNPATLFTVTGDVLVQVLGFIKTTLVSTGNAATLSLGATDAPAAFINSAAVDGTKFLAKQTWSIDAGTATNYAGIQNIYNNLLSENVVQQVGVADITAGKIDYYCFWRGLSSDANVVAA